MRLLLIEDDPSVSGTLKSQLEENNFAVDIAGDGQQGAYLAKINDYDLIVLDCNLPKKSGLEVCRELRETGKSTPILVLSVNAELDNKVELLGTGVDDYLTKPFFFAELLARVKALLRRPKPICKDVLQAGDLVLDTLKQTVTRAAKQIYLTRKEFQLLEYFMRNMGAVLSRGMIMEHVWDREGDLFSNTIETHILNLRRKIDKGFAQKLIHTVPGRGYRLDSVEVIVR